MKKLLFGLTTVALLISACSSGGLAANPPEPTPVESATDTPEPAATSTSVPPTLEPPRNRRRYLSKR
jgi:hypothetical protein